MLGEFVHGEQGREPGAHEYLEQVDGIGELLENEVLPATHTASALSANHTDGDAEAEAEEYQQRAHVTPVQLSVITTAPW